MLHLQLRHPQDAQGFDLAGTFREGTLTFFRKIIWLLGWPLWGRLAKGRFKQMLQFVHNEAPMTCHVPADLRRALAYP